MCKLVTGLLTKSVNFFQDETLTVSCIFAISFVFDQNKTHTPDMKILHKNSEQ
jgi:hypothetical protein